MGPLEDWLAKSLRQSGDPSRPTVTLSYAQSLDGSIALIRGEPLALSGPESREMTHRLRAAHDAIVVGIGTVISDDPQLNVRLVDGRNPQIIVLDSQLRTPLTSRILAAGPRLFCVASASLEAQAELERAGSTVERQGKPAAIRVDLPAMLRRLGVIGTHSLMVEGGGEVISSFVSEGLADRLVITIAPRFVGGYRIPTLSGGLSELSDLRTGMYGEDLVVWGEINHGQN